MPTCARCRADFGCSWRRRGDYVPRRALETPPFHLMQPHAQYDEADERHSFGAVTRTRPAPLAARAPREVVLCLSGGGFRAAAYHLGALRRLQELGVLRHVDEVRAVSGGSILAGFLALKTMELAKPLERLDWDADVAEPFRAILRQDHRTLPIALTAPINWATKRPRLWALERRLESTIGRGAIASLGDRPRIRFLVTDLASGDLVVVPGLAGAEGWSVARAVAVSAAFPPLFGPLRHTSREGGRPLTRALSDGGVWGNLGVSGRILRTARVLLVSDASYPLLPMSAAGARPFRLWLHRAIRVAQQRGDSALRYQMWLSDALAQRYEVWRISKTTNRPELGLPSFEYSPRLTERIATVRTDLDAFTQGEIAVLENHGYLRAASSMSWLLSRTRDETAIWGEPADGGLGSLSSLARRSRQPLVAPPHADFLEEDKCHSELVGSANRLLRFRTLRRFSERL